MWLVTVHEGGFMAAEPPCLQFSSSRGSTLIRQLRYRLSVFLTLIPSSISNVPQLGQIKEL